MSSFFNVKKQKPEPYLESYYQGSVGIEISLDLKVCVSVVRYKINNLNFIRPIGSLKFLHGDN